MRWSVWFAVLGVCASSLVSGCSSEGNPVRGGAGEQSDIGDVSVALQHGDVFIDQASYLITGPGSFTRSGTIDLRQSSTLSTIVSGIPAGTGYTITITAASRDGGITCTGSATFSIAARATTALVVAIQCKEPPRNGSVSVGGALNVCPVIDALSAAVAEVHVGATIALTGEAHDTDKGPEPLAYQWTSSTGAISGATSATATFSCTTEGPSVITLTASDGNCSDTMSATVTCSASPILEVHPTVETDPVAHGGDAADDPAIWVNPLDPSLSTIIGTDKTAGGGLGVYDLSGHQIQFAAKGALNNVDLRTGFPLGGETVALVTAGNRTDNSIAIYKIDPVTRQLVDVAARTINTLVTYGSCMYKSPVTGKFYYFVDSKAGEIEQWELFDNGAGLVDAVKVRNLPQLASQPEACVVDDELGFFYVGEEARGVWKFGAEPGGAPTTGVLVDHTGPGGHLVADVEGLALARTGAGTGFLIVANQGVSTYSVYAREGSNSYVKTFTITRGSACVDDVTGSDGIDVVTASLGPAFPSGVFVSQDNTNDPPGNQNFKLVPWQDILNGPPAGSGNTAACVAPDAGAPPADSGGATSDAPAGFPQDFCNAFCGKCATCWDPPGGFSEGDCLFQLVKPNFSLDDCLAGCAVGRTPGFPPSNLPANWESLACLAFDESI